MISLAEKKRKVLDKLLSKVQKLTVKKNYKALAETYRKAAVVAVDLGLETEVQEFTRKYQDFKHQWEEREAQAQAKKAAEKLEKKRQKVEARVAREEDRKQAELEKLEKLRAEVEQENQVLVEEGETTLGAPEPTPPQTPPPAVDSTSISPPPAIPSMESAVNELEELKEAARDEKVSIEGAREKIFQRTYRTMEEAAKVKERQEREAELDRERTEDLQATMTPQTSSAPFHPHHQGYVPSVAESSPEFYKEFINPETGLAHLLKKIQVKYLPVEEPQSGHKVVAVLKRAHGFYEIGVGKVWVFPNAINIMGPVMNTSDRVKRFNTGKIEVSHQLPKGEFLILRFLPDDVLEKIEKNIEIIPDYRLYHFYMDL
ncbi:MAG: hypothetical protein ACTSU5_19475 [Promethearchaeota archaeon]